MAQTRSGADEGGPEPARDIADLLRGRPAVAPTQPAGVSRAGYFGLRQTPREIAGHVELSH